ncbi:hypothetical protein K1719_043985 [Acacia pycnantha]|nr:hypothetical protein K1719_043985 [Acacia pycnantha]
MMMKILVWNSRGVASKGFAAVFRDIRFRYKMDVAVIMEPRISGSKASKVIRNWGYRHSVRVEGEGFSGGIWIVWDREDLSVNVTVKDEQFIHCKLALEGEEMLFTAVYANPNEQRRRQLWDRLLELANVVLNHG